MTFQWGQYNWPICLFVWLTICSCMSWLFAQPSLPFDALCLIFILLSELRGRVKPQHQQLPLQLSLLQCSTSSHIGWLGGGVLDLARRGEAESRDATLAAVVRKGLDPLFELDPAFCLRCAVSKVGKKKLAKPLRLRPSWPWLTHLQLEILVTNID